MRTLQKKVSLFIATGTVGLGIGVYAAQQFESGAGDVVQESPFRIHTSVIPGSDGPKNVTEDVPKYLETLPEPPAIEIKQNKIVSVPRPIPGNSVESATVLKKPAETRPHAIVKQDSPAEAPIQIETKITNDCATGARLLGDCNCFNETLGKVSLRLHPSQACIDEETKRLGHRLILASNDGHYQTMDASPHIQIAFEALEKQAEAERQGKRSRRLAEAESRLRIEMESRAEAERRVEMDAEVSQVPEQRKDNSTKIKLPFDPIAENRRLLELQATQVANLLHASGWIAPPYAVGVCPPGSKNEGCRCVIYPYKKREKGGKSVWVEAQYVPAANQPSYCNDPELQAAAKSPAGYTYVWMKVRSRAGR